MASGDMIDLMNIRILDIPGHYVNITIINAGIIIV